MRGRILCLLLALTPAAALADESPVGISHVETKDLRLYYIDSLSYLAPHAVRTFTNSLAWQRRMFGWVPSESTTVLLKDFADYGSANISVAPRNRVTVKTDNSPVGNRIRRGFSVSDVPSISTDEMTISCGRARG